MTDDRNQKTSITHEVINVDDFAVPSPSFTQAVKVTNAETLVFISGITARAADGSIVGEGDVELQTRTIFDNMRALLVATGGELENVVKTTTFVRAADDIPKVGAVRLAYFHGGPPASTSVEVSRLADPRQLVEIEAIAVLAPEVRS